MRSMTPMTTPLMLSAAGFRLAGYMLEKNLRVAQEFGRATVLANPFVAGMRVKYSPPVAKAEIPKKSTANHKTPATSAKPVIEAKAATNSVDCASPAPVAAKPVPAVTETPAPSGQIVQMTPASPAQKATPAQTDTSAAKRPRAPSLPPAMPAPRSVAVTGRDAKQG